MMEPMTVPTPPVTAAPPMNTAAMASSSQPTPSAGPSAPARATKIMPASAASMDMLTMTRKLTLGLHAGERGGVPVAADGVDVAAEGGVAMMKE